jgi:hypothetical protein
MMCAVFIYWCPETAPIKAKMLYSTVKVFNPPVASCRMRVVRCVSQLVHREMDREMDRDASSSDPAHVCVLSCSRSWPARRRTPE